LIVVPESVSDSAAVFAEPLAAAYGICEQVDIVRETKVAIIGDGKLGLLCAMTARLRSDHVSLVGKHPEKMAIVAKLGVEAIRLDAPKPAGFDVVIEASGSGSGFATALDLVRPRGKIVLKSTFEGKPTWQAARIVVDEISIIGSRCGRLAPAIELLASKRVDVDDLISEELPLEKGVDALERAGQKGVLKVLLAP
jgi:threonine dehydrogenase-like Zn-dependent dehydrogenase